MENLMALHEESEDQSFTDYSYDDRPIKEEEDSADKIKQRKKVKRLLEEKLERKRLKDEFKDDFDELSGEFDWDELDK
jgi:hypothetical protein